MSAIDGIVPAECVRVAFEFMNRELLGRFGGIQTGARSDIV